MTTESGQPHNEYQRDLVALGPFLADSALAIAADVVDDLEKVRCANDNRLRTLTSTSEDGHGMPEDHPDVVRLSILTGAIQDLEKQAVKNLEKAMKAHPLWAWAEPITGLGAKQFARLLQSVRDPYWNDLHDRPRTVSELWAYCGFHVIHPGGHRTIAAHSGSAAGSDVHTTDHRRPDNQRRSVGGVAPKRQRGQKSNWNENARKRCFLIAESLMKQKGHGGEIPHYRAIYDATREKYAAAVHEHPCAQCGPKGKPAQPGSPLSLGHQHKRALRKVSKELLKDLWREAKRIHIEKEE